MTRSEANPGAQPRSLYIHVPFCRHHCGYCNFTVISGRDHLVDDWLECVRQELGRFADLPTLETVYLGGGTPSRLSADHLQRLLDLVAGHFQLAPDAEITLEANPEDLPGELATVIEQGLVNRISLGVQSFQPARLRQLDRDHTPEQIERALDFVRETVPRFSLDLIFGLRDDSPSSWLDDLQRAIETSAGHVATYQLTMEKGTRFWNRQWHGDDPGTNEETAARLYLMALRRLTAAGLEHYEISAFARSGQRSRHNQVYWSGKPWIGIGPGAAGFEHGIRYTNHRSVYRYLQRIRQGQSPVAESVVVPAGEQALDGILFGLRQIEGVNLEHWQDQHGIPLDEVIGPGELEWLQTHRLATLEGNCLRLTRSGLLVADSVCQRLLASSPVAPPDQSP